MKVSFTVLLVSDKSQDASPSPANGSQQLLNKSSCVVSVSCSYSLSRFPFLSLLSLFITASFHHFSLLTFSSFLVPQIAHFLCRSPSNLMLIFAFSLHLHLLSFPPPSCSLFLLKFSLAVSFSLCFPQMWKKKIFLVIIAISTISLLLHHGGHLTWWVTHDMKTH